MGHWMRKSHRQSYREVPVLLRWWNPLELARNLPWNLPSGHICGTCWKSAFCIFLEIWLSELVRNLPSRVWGKLFMKKYFTAGTPPLNCPEGNAECWLLPASMHCRNQQEKKNPAPQELGTGKAEWAAVAGHWGRMLCKSLLSGYIGMRKQNPLLFSSFFGCATRHVGS